MDCTSTTLALIAHTGASIGTYSYGWDDNKNKTSESISGTLAGYGFTVGTNGYDTEDRLVNWQRSDTALDQSWNLSLVGDWNSITENTVAQNRTHGDTHELLTAGGSAVSHDAKGNQTLIPATLGTAALALNWDFENKLSTADVGNDSSVDVTYKFDALGRRVYRDDGTSAIVYVQSGQQTIADYGSGVAATTPMYRYVYASYIDEPVLRVDSSDAKLYYHRNQQYSIVALTDGVGAIHERYAYTAYGERTVLDGAGTVLSGSTNRYAYTGREWDEKLELYHYRARMYDPVAGRFVSRDPIGYYERSLNLFQFVHGQPTSYLDPMGLQPPVTAPPTSPFPTPPPPSVNPGTLPPGIGGTGPIRPPVGTGPIRPPVGAPIGVAGACRFVATRVCAPVVVAVVSYKCGEKISEYTTQPICVWATEWWCKEEDDDDDFCNCAEVAGLWEPDYGRVKSITRKRREDCQYPPDMCVGDGVRVGDKVL